MKLAESWKIEPGDVICTRNPNGWQAAMIRLGAALLDRPNTVNHVIVAHHQDRGGITWGIEARPGGVGWINLDKVLRQPYVVSNYEQPKTPAQRRLICAAVKGMIGTPYDWTAIALAGMQAVRADRLWRAISYTGVLTEDPPAHIICSALADWAYDESGLASPGLFKGRATTPGDWAAFIAEKAWQ